MHVSLIEFVTSLLLRVGMLIFNITVQLNVFSENMAIESW